MIEHRPDATARSQFAVCNQPGWDTERLYFAQNRHELGEFSRNPIGHDHHAQPAARQPPSHDLGRRPQTKIELGQVQPDGEQVSQDPVDPNEVDNLMLRQSIRLQPTTDIKVSPAGVEPHYFVTHTPRQTAWLVGGGVHGLRSIGTDPKRRAKPYSRRSPWIGYIQAIRFPVASEGQTVRCARTGRHSNHTQARQPVGSPSARSGRARVRHRKRSLNVTAVIRSNAK